CVRLSIPAGSNSKARYCLLRPTDRQSSQPGPRRRPNRQCTARNRERPYLCCQARRGQAAPTNKCEVLPWSRYRPKFPFRICDATCERFLPGAVRPLKLRVECCPSSTIRARLPGASAHTELESRKIGLDGSAEQFPIRPLLALCRETIR